MGVADIAEMIDLDACLQRCGLGLDEIADSRAVAERSPRPQPRIGSDRRLLADRCLHDVGKGMDPRDVSDCDAGTDHHERFDRDVAAKFRIGGEVNRLGRDHGDAGVERRLTQPRLHDLLGFRKLGLGVDAAHFVLAGLDHNRLQSHLANDGNRVAQIILALAVGVTDLFDDFKRLAAIERHHTGIAEVYGAFSGRRVGLLADRDQAVAFDQQSAVAGGIGGAKAEHGKCRAVFQWRAQTLERGGRNQRRIAKRNQQVVRAAGNGIAGGEHRMRGAQTLALNERLRVRTHALGLFHDSLVAGREDHGQRGAVTFRSGSKHMRQQRLARQRMQNLGHGGAHPSALAGREHDGEAGSSVHPNPYISGRYCAAAVIKGFRPEWKPDSPPGKGPDSRSGRIPVNVCCVIRQVWGGLIPRMAKNTDHLARSFEIENTGGLLTGFLAEDDDLDRGSLWRLGSWGAVSVGAGIVALLANQSSIGLRHDQVAAAGLGRQSQQIQSLAKESQNETRRLASAIDTLNGDRDRLYSRVTVLEQGLDSVTGTIARQNSAAVSAQPVLASSATAEPQPAPQSPAAAPAASPVATTLAATAEKPRAAASLPQQAPAP